MTSYISPKNVLVDFLRVNLTDGQQRAEASTIEEFEGPGTIFSLSPPSGKLSCVNSVTVDGTTQTKWKDYYIDFQNETVIFFSNTPELSTITINYKYGTSNWIYPDKPRVDLSATSFPRIDILVIGGTGDRLGQYNSDMETRAHFQIDIWTKENQVWTISSVKYEGDKLAEYLSYEITKSFKSSENSLHPALYNYTLLGTPRDMGFDTELQCFHKIVEVELRGINVGETYA